MLPEAEENGAHAQQREANCSLQSKISECGLLQVDIRYRLWNIGKKEKKKKLDFRYSEKNKPFRNSYSNLDFLIITTNLGGLAAMHT